MGIAIDLAVAKTTKYAVRESGDSVEAVERPLGGLSIVLVDGQGSGRAAKALSHGIAARAAALIGEGVRDGAVARAAHDALYAVRGGRVSATLDIISVDLRTRTVVLTRNAETPCVVWCGGIAEILPATAGPIGRYPETRPSVDQIALDALPVVLVYSDGIALAGERGGQPQWNVSRSLGEFLPSDGPVLAQPFADAVLAAAVARDAGRPGDDMTVVALTVRPHAQSLLIRRMAVEMPLP